MIAAVIPTKRSPALKQLVGSHKTGEIEVLEIPDPQPRRGSVLVRNRASLVSAGTERAMMEFAKKGVLGKARARPDLVRKVLDKVSRDGVVAATRAAFARLDEPFAPGYSCAGVVIDAGDGSSGLAPGDDVACGGAGYASHAEMVSVPHNLCAKVPDGVSHEDAAFVTVGSIAMHGFRLSGATVGDRVAVIGAGLVGQLAIQIAAAAGCRVIALDIAEQKVDLARATGASDGYVIAEGANLADAFAGARAADVVLVCAATKSSDPIHLAAEIARDRARVVAVGDVGLELDRRAFYHKELDLVVSRSYGPGRYDPSYEEGGHDYPIGHVRWTEKRNFESFLELVAAGKVTPGKLITHRYTIDEAKKAYEALSAGDCMGVVLSYPGDATVAPVARVDLRPAKPAKKDTVGLSVVGAGMFARSILLPAIAKARGVRRDGIASMPAMDAEAAGKKYKFAFCTSTIDEILQSENTDAVALPTRHSSHPALVKQVLEAGKAVIVEKPLAIDRAGLALVEETLKEHPNVLSVGFNRRFSPVAAMMRKALGGATPMAMHYTVNAGAVPADHWTRDPKEGGRVLGEAGHFIDLMCFLCGGLPESVVATGDAMDECHATIRFADGSTGSLMYTPRGDSSHTKERLEVFAGGMVVVMEDFRRLSVTRNGKTSAKTMRQEKGHGAEVQAFVDAVRAGGPAPVSFEVIRAVTLATLGIVKSAAGGRAVAIEDA